MSIEATRQKLEWLEGQRYSKLTWLEAKTTAKWPEHDREAKRHDLKMIEWLTDDYRRVLARQQQASEVA